MKRTSCLFSSANAFFSTLIFSETRWLTVRSDSVSSRHASSCLQSVVRASNSSDASLSETNNALQLLFHTKEWRVEQDVHVMLSDTNGRLTSDIQYVQRLYRHFVRFHRLHTASSVYKNSPFLQYTEGKM